MTLDSFNLKWRKIKDKDGGDEQSLFVEFGKEPMTQRQLNLYNYFLFIKEVLKKIKAKRVLEIGCGRGTMSLYLEKYLGLETVLLDNSAEAMEVAKNEFAKHGLTPRFYLADALDTKLAGERFDAIISIGLAEHIDQVDKLFKEQYRLLKPGGAVISLNIPQKFSIQFLNNIFRLFKKVIGRYKESLKKDYYRNALKPRDYSLLAKQAGFCDIQITHVCPFPIFTPLSITADKKVAKIYKMILLVRKLFQGYVYKTNPCLAQAHFLVGKK